MESLTLEQAYYIGELIAAFVVVISLIYLALQVRASNQVSLIESLGTFSPRLDKCFEFLTIPENAKLYLTASNNYEDLDEEQKLRYRSFFQQLLNVFEDFYLMSQAGVQIGDSEGRRILIHDMLRTPGGRSAWKDIRLTNEASFREVIDAIAEAKGEKDFSW
jgi:hypothetical protein